MLLHEKYREAHESLDYIEDIIAQQFIDIPIKHRDRLAQEHYIGALLDKGQTISEDLLNFYTDTDNSRLNEISQIIQTSSSLDLLPFYKQLQLLRQLHRSEDVSMPYANDFVPFLAVPIHELIAVHPVTLPQLDSLFSGEEGFGKYLDLNSLYLDYCNLKGAPQFDYLTYIDLLDKLDAIPMTTKFSPSYSQYLNHLIEYLEGFIRRAKPLYPLDDLLVPLSSLPTMKHDLQHSDYNYDAANPLYCQPCQKLFSKDTVFQAHLTGKKHLKAFENFKNHSQTTQCDSILLSSTSNSSKEHRLFDLKEKESRLRALFTLLRPFKDATIANLERKQSRTAEELQEEDDDWDDEQVLEESNGNGNINEEEKEIDRLYNPLKLPLGWDGKPIPYWLYKLHGLSVSYPCEICGNYVYMGRKAFDKHFQEWRHAQGMKCLGLPNTKHFYEITTIQDAYALAEKLKKDAKAELFRRDTMEEFEDAEGNVFNRKTFEDLHRQGLI